MNVFGKLDPALNFSILIPSYNDNSGLIDTLESLSDEIYSNILIVDDGSDYPVYDLLKKYITPHNIVILQLKKNSGIIIALNSGIDFLYNNRIRYVYRLDSCDLHCNGRIKKQMDKMVSTGAAIVGGHVEYFDDNSSFILELPTEYEQIKRMQYYRSCFIHPAVLLDLSKIETVNTYKKKYLHAEDYDLFLRVVKKNTAVNIDEIVVKCLIRSNGLSLSNRKKQISSVLKSQMDNIAVLNIFSYLGILKTIVIMIVPMKIVNIIKKFFIFR